MDVLRSVCPLTPDCFSTHRRRDGAPRVLRVREASARQEERPCLGANVCGSLSRPVSGPIHSASA